MSNPTKMRRRLEALRADLAALEAERKTVPKLGHERAALSGRIEVRKRWIADIEAALARWRDLYDYIPSAS